MKTFSYTITDDNGIHARPAGILVKAAAGYSSDVTIAKGEKSASAKKLFAIMSLGVKKNDTVTVTVNGADEDNAAAELEKFFNENL